MDPQISISLAKPPYIPRRFSLPSKAQKSNSTPSDRTNEVITRNAESVYGCRLQIKGGFVKTCCIAEWSEGDNHAVVHTIRGDFQKSIGYMNGPQWCLFPEEALYLCDRGNLQMFWDDAPLSLEQMIGIVSKTFAFEKYLVYAHLKRKGFVIRRHVQGMPSDDVAPYLEGIPTTATPIKAISKDAFQVNMHGKPLNACLKELATTSNAAVSSVPTSIEQSAQDAIVFDGYFPAKGFKLSQPRQPDFFVLVQKSHEPVSFSTIHQLTPTGVPVWIASVQNMDVIVYEANTKPIPAKLGD